MALPHWATVATKLIGQRRNLLSRQVGGDYTYTFRQITAKPSLSSTVLFGTTSSSAQSCGFTCFFFWGDFRDIKMFDKFLFENRCSWLPARFVYTIFLNNFIYPNFLSINNSGFILPVRGIKGTFVNVIRPLLMIQSDCFILFYLVIFGS